MYISIDLSANLRLDTVVLQYIIRVFLDKVNLFLSLKIVYPHDNFQEETNHSSER